MKAFTLFSLISMLFAGASKASANTYVPSSWEKQVIAACLVLEAANQGEVGMKAVASVILNRADGQRSKVLRVIKTPYAFSALNTASTGRTGSRGYANHVQKASRDRHWASALEIVDEMFSSHWHDITHGADHYVRKDLRPRWTRTMSVTTIIGSHAFYASY